MHLTLQLPYSDANGGLGRCPRVAALLRTHGLHAEPLFRQPRGAEMSSYWVVPLESEQLADLVHREVLATGELRGAYVARDAVAPGRARDSIT